MKIALLEKKIFYFKLPTKVDGSFLMPDGLTSENLVNIEAISNQWVMNSNDDTKIISGNSYVESVVLAKNNFYVVEKGQERKLLYSLDTCDSTFVKYSLESDCAINVGSDFDNDLIYNHGYVGKKSFILNFSNGVWSLKRTDQTVIYLNDQMITTPEASLAVGDTLFVYGLKIIFYGKMILINNPNNLVTVKTQFLNVLELANLSDVDDSIEVKEKNLYTDSDYFLKSPRIKRFVEEKEIKMTPPPHKEKEDDTPAIYVYGPMIATATMGITNLANTFAKLLNNETSLVTSWPQLLTGTAMVATTAIWPFLTRNYKKKQSAAKEKKRLEKYREYLQGKTTQINDLMKEEAQILEENLLTYSECRKIILNKDRRLWERKLEQKDFLTVRIGTGAVDASIKLSYQLDDFSMDDDVLRKELESVVKQSNMLVNVPIGYSFLDKRISAVIGNYDKIDLFLKSILVQILAYHSYDELKIVVFTDEQNLEKWDCLRHLPHCFSDDRQVRFFASTKDARNDLGDYFSKIVKSRKNDEHNNSSEVDYSKNKPYYLIFTDIISDVRNLDAINEILETDYNLGFSLIIKEKEISKLPSKCTNFINLGIVNSDVLVNDAEVNKHQSFNDELIEDFDLEECCKILANVPIKFEGGARSLPNVFTFLEMYNVGKVEQLNAMYRWQNNNPIKSLKAEIGIDDLGKPIYLDLHEKAHGPHGLIAGMTGSGKSELIITYILSMALNYSPNEVAFILIDYKGGGLVGAFENQKLGIRLPHLAGKITNLDKAEMKRTLVSINSELRRRQAIFNSVRDELGESTIDIYKYQRFFREGKISNPVPHLFLISDEFAELKAQQPEFMDELISAARIGRSLGVHLILATQKPSGVVNEQIWSNSRFRICLKVQDKSDSNEMIKCPDAAEIRQAGRFYLQVGYNEIFQLGQSGWCGAPYFPSNVLKKEYDRSVNFISDIGSILASASNENNKKKLVADGDELSSVLKYIISVADKENIYARKMWLDSIPPIIYVDDLIKKYNLSIVPYKIDAILGEYDDPNNQRQNILKIPLTENGNTIIYSVSSSDRDRALNSIIYSTVMYHSVDEINYYIVDYGAETLRAFSKLPHVGDMVFAGEKEKLTNLFKLIDDMIAERKKLFANYSGQYLNYCMSNEEKLPFIVVILNDFDALCEGDFMLQETISQYCRDCERYGISFILTCNNVSSVRGKMRQSFKNTFALEMNNPDDYNLVVGNWKHVCLFDFPGRGLVNLDDVYEFQTASILPEENFNEMLNTKIEELISRNNKRAPKIPVLPDVVSLGMLKNKLSGFDSVPIGMSNSTLECISFDFTDTIGNIIASNDINNSLNFIKVLIKEFKMLGANVTVVEADKMLYDYSSKVDTYVNSNFEQYFNQLNPIFSSVSGYKILIIMEPSKIKSKMVSDIFTPFFNEIKRREDIRVIFVNSSGKSRELDIVPWYSGCVNKQNGIWIGSGICEQSCIRVGMLSKEARVSLNNSFGWCVKNGNLTLVKLVESEDLEENG